MPHLIIAIAFAAVIVAAGILVYFGFLASATSSLNDERSLTWRRRKEIRQLNEEASLSELGQGDQLFSTEGSGTLTDRFISDLSSQAKTGLTSVSIGTSIDEISFQLYDRANWPRFFASFAVYFGLLGTIGGLYAALDNLQGATQIHDESTLRTFAQSIRELLGSLQGAFLSAGAGVVGSVFMGWLVQKYDTRCSAYLSELNELGHKELLPYLERQRLELLPTSSVEAARTLVAQLGKTLNSFTKAWSDRFDSLARETGLVAASTAKLLETTKSLEATSDTMAESATVLDGTLKALTSATAAEVRAMEQSRHAIESASESVRTLAERAVSWPDISEKLIQTSSSVESAGASVRTSADGLQAATAALQTALRGLQQHVREISDESFEDLSEKLAGAIAEVVSHAISELSKVTKETRARDERIEIMVDAIRSVTERQDRYLSDLTIAVNSMIALIPALEDPRPTLEQLLTSMRSVSDSIDQAAAAFDVGSQHSRGETGSASALELTAIKNQLADISTALGHYRMLREAANRRLDQIQQALANGRGPREPEGPEDGSKGRPGVFGIFRRNKG